MFTGSQGIFCARANYKDFPKSSIFQGVKPALLLLAALVLLACNPPSESSSSKSTPPTPPITGTTTDTNNPDVKKVTDAAAFKMTESITYYKVKTDEKVVQIEPSDIGINITGNVSWAVTKVGKNGEVGYISDAVKATIKASTDKPNQLEIPKDTVGFFEVQVSAKNGAANKPILLAAGPIEIPATAITIKEVPGLTVDAANKVVSVINASAGTKFTVGELDETKFADGVPKYALAYSATGMGADKLVQAINSSTGEVTLGSGIKDDIAVNISGAAQGPYKALATLVITLKKVEPQGKARYTFTPKGPPANKKFTLTVNEGVTEIKTGEFDASEAIITAKARTEGVSRPQDLITEIILPSTLTKIGPSGFERNESVSGTLKIPRNVETIGRAAFRNLAQTLTRSSQRFPSVVFGAGSKLKAIGGNSFENASLKNFKFPENLETIESGAFRGVQFTPSGTLIIPSNVSKTEDAFVRATGITAVDIRSEKLAKPASASAPFPLGRFFFHSSITGITEIKLPQVVYDSYTKAELQAIFGTNPTNYRKPDGTAYDFTNKP